MFRTVQVAEQQEKQRLQDETALAPLTDSTNSFLSHLPRSAHLSSPPAIPLLPLSSLSPPEDPRRPGGRSEEREKVEELSRRVKVLAGEVRGAREEEVKLRAQLAHVSEPSQRT
eukprot:516772-Rhodomonas_salina.1